MKKILAIILAFVLCFAGCSGENSVSEPAKPEEFVPARGTVENGIYKNCYRPIHPEFLQVFCYPISSDETALHSSIENATIRSPETV